MNVYMDDDGNLFGPLTSFIARYLYDARKLMDLMIVCSTQLKVSCQWLADPKIHRDPEEVQSYLKKFQYQKRVYGELKELRNDVEMYNNFLRMSLVTLWPLVFRVCPTVFLSSLWTPRSKCPDAMDVS